MCDSSEEDDYMSDAVLKQCQDVRPGLMSSKSLKETKREKLHEKKNVLNKTKPLKVLEKEKREEGLGVALSSDNKGFAMLQKMGYKPGTAIGRTGVGRVEPVPVVVKTNRGGLGQEAHQKRKREIQIQMRASMAAKRSKMEERRKGDFMDRKSKQFSEKLAEQDLYKSQKVCAELDSQQGLKEPAELFFWPMSYLPPQQAPDKVVSDDDDSERGDDLTAGYSLTAYDPADLSDDDTNITKDLDDSSDEIEFSTEQKLEILTLYLRNKYLYCVWCATTFNDIDDLEENCPGCTAEAHS